VLATTSCLLNPNRNANRSPAEIEQALRDYLGGKQIIWLGDGIEGDDTDGHIDDITRFVAPNVVVTALETDPKDSNYEPLQKNLEILQAVKLADGSALEILTLPMPPRIERRPGVYRRATPISISQIRWYFSRFSARRRTGRPRPY